MSEQLSLSVDGVSAAIPKIESVSQPGTKNLSLSEASRKLVAQSRQFIEQRMASGEAIYGLNTGFGAFATTRVKDSDLARLQVNLIRSHAAGIGEPFSRQITRAILFLRANTLARGHSGVRPEVIEMLLGCLNQDLLPVIPCQGSVGASGDLAPLAHVALALIGEGEFWVGENARLPAIDALAARGLKPLILQAKEGLALINGCQVMTAVAALALARFDRCLRIADIAGAMSLEALRGSRRAFDELISAVRPHRGEIQTAANLRRILGKSSAIGESHVDCGRVQDAYSLRCMPAVHGAAKDAWARAVEVIETEANSSTDNPLTFAERGELLSCGNFHGEPVAFQCDFAAIAATALASISERRLEKLINPAASGLPPFLAPQGGLNSGHMIVHVAAASLVSESKILSHPASVDTIPTSADKEDHVSMGTIAARKFSKVVNHLEAVLAMELLGAAQGLDLLAPLRPEGALKVAHDCIRSVAPFAAEDRVFHRDVEAVRAIVRSGHLLAEVERACGPISG